MARNRQRPKRSKRARTLRPAPMPRHGETITTTVRHIPQAQYAPTPQTGEYHPPDIHAVTTNQEPPATWPPVDLPGETMAGFDGMAVAPLPGDNGQADPQTIYDGAGLDEVPYSDYNQSPGVDYPGSI